MAFSTVAHGYEMKSGASWVGPGRELPLAMQGQSEREQLVAKSTSGQSPNGDDPSADHHLAIQPWLAVREKPEVDWRLFQTRCILPILKVVEWRCSNLKYAKIPVSLKGYVDTNSLCIFYASSCCRVAENYQGGSCRDQSPAERESHDLNLSMYCA